MKNVSHLSLEERRKLLEDYLSTGRIASVEWVKKDGTIAKRTVQLWRESALTYGKEFIQPNPTAHKPNLFTCYETELNKEAKWCNVSLDKLVSIKMNGEIYGF